MADGSVSAQSVPPAENSEGWQARDTIEQEELETAQLLRGQNEALELIARGAPLRETLEFLLRVIEAQSPGMFCSILLLDRDGVHVRHGAAPSLPESYTRAIDGQRIGPHAGSCGTAAFRRETVIVEDIATDPLWDDYRDFALRHGLRACWSIPILAPQGRVLGTFALYFPTPCRPEKRHRYLIELATHTAAIALVKHQEAEALRSSEERLRLAVTGGNLGIWEWDVSTNSLLCSLRLKAMFGWPLDAADLDLDRFIDAIHPEDRGRVADALRLSIAQRTRCDVEFRVVWPDRSLRWVAAKGRGEYDDAGLPVRMVGVGLDVTDRKQAEEEIHRRDALLAEAQRIAKLGSYEWDVRQNTVYRSEELCRIFGLAPGEFPPTLEAYLERVHPQDRAATRRILEQTFRDRQPFLFEERIVRSDGAVRLLCSRGKWILDQAQQPVKLVGICEDVTERREAEDHLRRSDERFQIVVRATNDVIWDWDLRNDTVWWNQGIATLFGYSSARVGAGIGWRTGNIHPDDVESVLSGIRSAMERGEQCWSGEYRFRRADGSYADIFDRAFVVHDSAGKPIRMIGAMADMTERKRAQEHVLKSRLELQAVLDNSPALIYMKDEAGRYTFVNRCWTDSFRRSIEDVRGRTDFDLFPEAAARQFISNDGKVAKSGKTLEFEEETPFEGGLRSYHSVKVALRDGAGRLYALCGISTDITERKAKEQSLRQVHRALRVLSSCNSVVVHATEEQSLLNDVCRVAVGPAGYKMAWIGYADDDEPHTVRPVATAGPAAGFLDRIHVSWADNEHGRGAIGRAIREGRPVVVRRIREQPDFAVWREALETRSFQSVLAVPLRLGNNICGAFGIYADEPDAFDPAEVTLIVELGENVSHGISSIRAHNERAAALAALESARSQLEERVRQRTAELVVAKEAAESADHLKSAFLASMSHELRTPLNSIIGFTGIVLQGLAGPLNAEQTKQLGMVQNSARHLLDLINDVLDISKIEAGQLEITSRVFSLPQAIEKAVATVLPLAQAKGISLRTAISPEVNRICSDQRRTEQILLNLLGNAVKFTDEGEVVVESRRENERAVISIRDTGIGIDPKQHQSIFEPFRQADAGLARKHEGTGLGLSICRRLVERLGGSISLASIPGQGSTFTVQLPLELDKPGEQHSSGY